MEQPRWLRAFGLGAASLMLISHVLQAQGDPAALQQKLSVIKLTTTTADRTDIVTPGDIVALHKPGLVMFSVDSPLPPTNVYKNGRIGQGLGTVMMMSDNNHQKRIFVPEEKCWVTRILVQNDGVEYDLYSDPYNDVRYYGVLKFPFPEKKVFPPVDSFVQTISDVISAVPQDSQASAPAQPPPNDSGAGSDLASSLPGKYIMVGSSDYVVFNPDGTVNVFQRGQNFQGIYKVIGQFIILSGPQIPAQRCRLTGDTIADGLGRLWKRDESSSPAPAQAAAPAPAPMQAIAPPPPPADTPPPTIALGQTVDQVTAGFGQPSRIAKLGAKEIYYYKDMKVTFVNGKVTNVE